MAGWARAGWLVPLMDAAGLWLKTADGVVVPSPWEGWDPRVPLEVFHARKMASRASAQDAACWSTLDAGLPAASDSLHTQDGQQGQQIPKPLARGANVARRAMYERQEPTPQLATAFHSEPDIVDIATPVAGRRSRWLTVQQPATRQGGRSFMPISPSRKVSSERARKVRASSSVNYFGSKSRYCFTLSTTCAALPAPRRAYPRSHPT